MPLFEMEVSSVKKLTALLLAVLWMLSGCTIIIVDPFATAPSQEIAAPTEPPTQPTEETEEPTEITEAPTVETEPTIPEGGGMCGTCGLHYAEGEGFEGLCFVCQEKYGPKCSTCGTDCTYRGSIDGLCDDCYERMCYHCGTRGFAEDQMCGNLCYNCSTMDITCAQCGKQCDFDGLWVETYFCCSTCSQKQPCALCGDPYYIWDMFEGVCFNCDDPSGGEAGLCIVCHYASGDYDGYCYYCHPDFGFTCSKCGYEQPYHRTESGLCINCEGAD